MKIPMGEFKNTSLKELSRKSGLFSKSMVFIPAYLFGWCAIFLEFSFCTRTAGSSRGPTKIPLGPSYKRSGKSPFGFEKISPKRYHETLESSDI
jgi:hypothetical protein